MFVAENGLTGFYGPKLTHSPTFPAFKFIPRVFNPNPASSKSESSSQFLLRRTNFLRSQRGRGGRFFGLLRTMDGDGEDDDKAQAERNGVLEQEDLSPLFAASSRSPSPTARTGLQPTLNRLSKWLVAALFTAAILWRHDAEALWAAMGSVLNSALSVVLKRILNQERPNSAISSGPGMPSSHAQSISYAVIFIIWSLMQWLGVNELSLVLSALIFAFGSYLSWLRVSQQYHTMSQVSVGAAVGSGFALFWLWTWQAFVVHAFASSFWVRLLVVGGSVLFCLCFLVHVIRHWIRDEQ